MVVSGVLGRAECQSERSPYAKTQSFLFRKLQVLWPDLEQRLRGGEEWQSGARLYLVCSEGDEGSWKDLK